MVGALADWFAVTALFRHPLGLPIPHTAIIPDQQGPHRPQPRRVRPARTSSPPTCSPSVGEADVAQRRRAGWPSRPTPTGWRRHGRRCVARAWPTCSTTTTCQRASRPVDPARGCGTSPAAPLLARGSRPRRPEGTTTRSWTRMLHGRRRTSTTIRAAPPSWLRASRRGGCPSRSTTASSPRSSAARSASGRAGGRPGPRAAARIDDRLAELVGRPAHRSGADRPGRAPQGRAARTPRRAGAGRRRCGATSRRDPGRRPRPESATLRRRLDGGARGSAALAARRSRSCRPRSTAGSRTPSATS